MERVMSAISPIPRPTPPTAIVTPVPPPDIPLASPRSHAHPIRSTTSMLTEHSLRRSRPAPVHRDPRGDHRRARTPRRTCLEVLVLEGRQLLNGLTPSAFDFGTSSSPVASGYTKVSDATTFSGGAGIRLALGVDRQPRSRHPRPPAARQRLHLENGVFAVNVADGTYDVTLTVRRRGIWRTAPRGSSCRATRLTRSRRRPASS